jgi:hypothetical protein
MKACSPKIARLFIACLCALSAVGCAGTTTRSSTAADPAPATEGAAPARELTDATCAEYLDLVERVKLQSEAKGAAKSQDALDDLVDVQLWLHGYLSGRKGIDNQARPLTRDWLASSVGVLARACAVDESRRVVDVVAGIE